MPYIIEGINTLSALVDLAKDVKDLAPNKGNDDSTYLSKSSIMKASKDLIMSFPVLCSDTITPKTATMICKAVERNCVTTLQLLFSSAYLSGKDGREILQMWHNNMAGSIGMDELLDISDAIGTKADGLLGESAKFREVYNEYANEDSHVYPVSSFSEKSISDYSTKTLESGERNIYYNPIHEDNSKLDKEKLEYDRNRNALESKHTFLQKQLLDSDVKKCNELIPSLFIVRYNVVNPGTTTNTTVEKEFVAGVKARLISCSSEEIISHIESVNKNKVSLVNLVRATTKEISFCKDFVAAIDQAKIDAKNNSVLSKTSPVWRSLQSRATASGLNRLKRNKANDAGAITTLVITSEEANMLAKEDNLDLNIPTVAKSVMEAYNLMCLVIVDEDIEVAKFLMDGEKYYQDYSFGSLERETGDSSYKKIINLISRINRG